MKTITVLVVSLGLVIGSSLAFATDDWEKTGKNKSATKGELKNANKGAVKGQAAHKGELKNANKGVVKGQAAHKGELKIDGKTKQSKTQGEIK